jgi:hypothetical protein
MGEGVTEVSLYHFGCLNTFDETWWCAEGGMNVYVADVVNVTADEFDETVDEFWGNLKGDK